MGHSHHHHHSTGSNIKLAFCLNLGFSIIELIGGLMTQSVAILADAVHDMGDALSLGLAWYLQKKSDQSSDARYSYGYRRFSLLSAILTAIFLLVASIFVLKETITRFFDPLQPHAEGMLFLAVLGILVNGFAAWKTSHGNSMNEKVVSWHMIEDLLGWVVVFFGSIVMMFVDFPLLDPIMSIGFTLFVLRGVYRVLIETSALFLQSVPSDMDMNELLQEVKQIEGVIDMHDCHIWSLDGENHVLTMHVIIADATASKEIQSLKEKIRLVVAKKGKIHLTLEMEFESEDCPDAMCVLEH